MTPAEFAKHWLERCATIVEAEAGPFFELDYRLAERLIEADRAAVREPLERQVRELETDVATQTGAVRSMLLRAQKAEQRISSLEAQLSKREPTQEEGDADDPNGTGECFVDGWTGRRCRHCNRWTWSGPTACVECVARFEAREGALREACDVINALDAGPESLDANIGEERGLTRAEQAVEALLTSPPKSPSRPTENRCGQCDGTGTDYDVPDSCGTTCDVCRGSGVLPELPPPVAQKEPSK